MFHFCQCLCRFFFCFSASLFQHGKDSRNILFIAGSSFPYGGQLCLKDFVQEFLDFYVAKSALFIMLFQLLKVVIFRPEFGKGLVCSKGFQINKDRISFYLSGILYAEMVGICEHRHNLFPDGFLRIREIDAVSQRFAHLRLSIRSRKAELGLFFRKKNLRLYQNISVNGIELPHNFPRLLQHRFLILTGRNYSSFEGGNVCRLADGVAEESHWDAVLKVFLLYFRFDSRIALYSGNCNKIHIIERHLCQFRDLGLN